MVDFDGFHVGKYTMTMDPMGKAIYRGSFFTSVSRGLARLLAESISALGKTQGMSHDIS